MRKATSKTTSNKTTNKSTETVTTKSITEFFNTDYKDWAKSVVEERAIPSVIDGFKPTARKVVHASIIGSLKDGKLYKLLALSGDSMKLSLYSHGDASLNSVIVNLCKDFSDNLNPIESDSQVGTLRDPDSAGSPRYLYVRHSKWMELIYKADYNLLNFVFEEGQYVEPENYLPIIPSVLCKNNIGVAVGYAMHNISYSPIDVCDACIEFLKSGKVKNTEIRPYIRGIDSINWKKVSDEESNNEYWTCKGVWSFNLSKDKMIVTNLPYDMTFDNFEKLLTKYEESGYIKSWTNLSHDSTLNYEIQFNKGTLRKATKTKDWESKFVNKFKLIKVVPNDLLWLLDENKNLTYYNNIYEIICYFCDYRLGIYKERKKRLVKILEEKEKSNSDLCKFIKLVISGKLKIRNRTKSEIKEDMDKEMLNLPLLNTPMSKLTKEEYEALQNENKKISEELDYIKNTSEKDMYINDLKSLRKELVKEFK